MWTLQVGNPGNMGVLSSLIGDLHSLRALVAIILEIMYTNLKRKIFCVLLDFVRIV